MVPRRAAGLPSMLDMPETPQLPEEVRRNRDVARQRTEELQGLFVSQHAAECEALHSRLDALDHEEASLRSTLASLQRELDEATEQRRAKDVAAWEGLPEAIAEGGPGTGAESPVAAGDSGDRAGSPGRSASPAPSPFSARREPGGPLGTPRLMAGSRENPMSPILNRRRAEARLREATAAHEASMAQMRASVAELERRSHKQRCWMDLVEKRVLEAEIEKVRVRVRLDKASKRKQSLSQDLSRAYHNVVKLLEERLRLQDVKAHNEATLAYLDVVGRADLLNEISFLENRAELCQVMKLVKQRQALEGQLQVLTERAEEMTRFANLAQHECQDLLKINHGFQSDWVRVPTVLKDARTSNTNRMKVTRMHPVSAMQAVTETLTACHEELKDFGEKLAKVLQYETAESRTAVALMSKDWSSDKKLARRASC